MLSGRETLGHLDGSLVELRTQLDRLDRELQTMSAQIARSQLEQSEIVKQLATIRLDAITSDRVGQAIDSADRQVHELLERREKTIGDLNAVVEASSEKLARLETERAKLHDRVDDVAGALADREARVQAQLAEDEGYRAQLERTQGADATALSAEEKARVAAADRAEKRGPYDRDPLFSYLWQRSYGTSEYRANPLMRALDGWVARLCRYEDARRNYWMLLEIPKRLEQHAAGVRKTASGELEKLRALEADAAERGGVNEARAALADAEAKQDAADQEIDALERELQDVRLEQGRFAAGDDDYLKKCLAVLEAAAQHASLESLTSLARSTMSLEDDRLVERLGQARRDESELHGELEEHREMHRQMLRRLEELTAVRSRFKQHRYDDLRSGFNNGDMLLLLLQQVLAGTLRSGSFWDALTRHQRYRDVSGAWPDFGSGGIARRSGGGSRPSSKPPWHWPGGGGGRKGFRLPSGGRRPRGGGGFRTGGGF